MWEHRRVPEMASGQPSAAKLFIDIEEDAGFGCFDEDLGVLICLNKSLQGSPRHGCDATGKDHIRWYLRRNSKALDQPVS